MKAKSEAHTTGLSFFLFFYPLFSFEVFLDFLLADHIGHKHMQAIPLAIEDNRWGADAIPCQ